MERPDNLTEADLDALEDAAEALELEAEAEQAATFAEGRQRSTLGCEWARVAAVTPPHDRP